MKTIALTRGFVTVIDDDDFAYASRFRWFVSDQQGSTRYAYRTLCRPGAPNRTVPMHRDLLRVLPGFVIDHANGDGLDNRRQNLRICSQSQNLANSTRAPGVSGFRGVYAHRRRWIAQISAFKNRIKLGSFDTREDAARAYDEAAKKYYGEFARLNFGGVR